MKKTIAYALMIILFFLLQSSLFGYFRIAGIAPNLLIILTASVAIIHGSTAGCLTGFFSGLMLDLIFGPYLGLYALGYLICGYLVGISNRIFYKEDITLPILMITGADLFYGVYVYIMSFLVRGRTDFLFYLRRIILPDAVYTVIVSLVVYRLILFISMRLEKRSDDLIA